MALSQRSKDIAKQVLNNDNFNDTNLKETYGVTQDELISLVEDYEPEALAAQTYNMYLRATNDEDTAHNYADYIKNFATNLKEQSRLDDEALYIKEKADEAAAKRRENEFKAIKNDNLPDTDISIDLLKEYGNNFFVLYTYDPSVNNGKNNGRIDLCGVLKQLPPFSIKQKAWSTGPAASMSDIVKAYLCNDMMEQITVLGGNDRSFNTIDETSDRVYEGTENVSFNLNFRIYTTQPIGSKALTSWKTWIKALSLYAQPSIASKMNINAIGNNVVNGVLQGFDNVSTIIKTGFNTLTSDKTEGLINTLSTTIEETMNTASTLVTNRDDENRVSGNQNKKSYYGAKLWKLRILPRYYTKTYNNINRKLVCKFF